MGSNHETAFLDALRSIGMPKTAEAESVEEGSHDKEVGTTQGPSVGGVTKSNIWQHPDAHPIALDLALLRRFGAEWLEWEADTLRIAIPEEFSTPSLSDLNLAKIQACRTLHLVDSFWQRWETFLWCSMSFNGEFPDFREMQVPAVGQMLIACDIAGRIREDVGWSPEVCSFVAAVFEHDGVFLALPPCDFAASYLEEALPEDLNHTQLVAEWPKTRASGKAPTGSSILDEQLRRLLSVNDFLEESRSRLQRQLALHV